MNGINTVSRAHKIRRAYSDSATATMKRIIKLKGYGVDTDEILVVGDCVEKLFREVGEVDWVKEEPELTSIWKRNPLPPQLYGPNFNLLNGKVVCEAVGKLLQSFVEKVKSLSALSFAELPLLHLTSIETLAKFIETMSIETRKISYFGKLNENNRSLYLQACLYRIPDLATKTIERFYFVFFARILHGLDMLPQFDQKLGKPANSQLNDLVSFRGTFINYLFFLDLTLDKPPIGYDKVAYVRNSLVFIRILLTFDPYKQFGILLTKTGPPNEIKPIWNRLNSFDLTCYEIQALNQMETYVVDMDACAKMTFEVFKSGGLLEEFRNVAYLNPKYLEKHTVGVQFLGGLTPRIEPDMDYSNGNTTDQGNWYYK